MPGSRKEDFLEKGINFTPFTPQLSPLGLGVMKYKMSCLLTLRMLHTKFCQDWPCSSWDRQRTDDARRRMPPILIAIGHLSNSDDFKIAETFFKWINTTRKYMTKGNNYISFFFFYKKLFFLEVLVCHIDKKDGIICNFGDNRSYSKPFLIMSIRK